MDETFDGSNTFWGRLHARIEADKKETRDAYERQIAHENDDIFMRTHKAAFAAQEQRRSAFRQSVYGDNGPKPKKIKITVVESKPITKGITHG